MKLGFKIFWSILLISLITLGASAVLLIQASHRDNLGREQERALSEYDMIAASIDNALATARLLSKKESTGTEDAVLRRFDRYYSQKGIRLYLESADGTSYRGEEPLQMVYEGLSDSPEGNYRLTVRTENGKAYILVAAWLPQQPDLLIYARDIQAIYDAREENIRLFLSIGLVLVVMVAFGAVLVSRGLTRPLARLEKSALELAGGHSVILPEGKDEIGSLARSFNAMAQAVQLREQKLKEQVESRQRFIDDLAHEMNTPLTSIQGYAALLEQANCTEEQRRKATGYIQHETRRMKALHQKLRLLSIMEQQDFQPEQVLVERLFFEVGDQLRPLLRDHNMRLIGRIAAESIWGDMELLVLLLSNLVRNAVLYSPQGGTVELEAYRQDDAVFLSVADHGVGISPENQEKIFDPFYRVDKSRSRQTGGTGLGLSVCRRIADLHGAAIVVQSAPNEGTTMTLRFPTQTVTTS